MTKLNISYAWLVVLYELPLVLILFLSFALIVFTGCMFILHHYCTECEWSKSVLDNLKKFFLRSLGESFFGLPHSIVSFEVTKRIDTQNINTPNYKWACWMLSIAAFFLLTYASTLSWNVFLFKESYVYDDSLDCLARPNVSEFPFQVTDCSLYTEDEDYKFICYNLTLSIGTALATFGGLITAFKYVFVVSFKANYMLVNFFRIPVKHKFCFGLIPGSLVLLFSVMGGFAWLTNYSIQNFFFARFFICICWYPWYYSNC